MSLSRGLPPGGSSTEMGPCARLASDLQGPTGAVFPAVPDVAPAPGTVGRWRQQRPGSPSREPHFLSVGRASSFEWELTSSENKDSEVS